MNDVTNFSLFLAVLAKKFKNIQFAYFSKSFLDFRDTTMFRKKDLIMRTRLWGVVKGSN